MTGCKAVLAHSPCRVIGMGLSLFMMYYSLLCRLHSDPRLESGGFLFSVRFDMSGKEKRPIGRPTKYKPEYAEQAYKLCLLGAIDADMADFFNVEVSTINNWKNEFPEFLESIKKGKMLADANVADRLYQRAMGYEAPDVDIRVVGGEIIQTPLTKYYPPDTPAAIFWLKNRQRGKWSDKSELDVKSSDGSMTPTVRIDTEEYRKIAEDVLRKI
nr:MAG TPA: terminase small subunit [Caudoviricetes sp.]